MVGEPATDTDVNFEWPTEADLDRLGEPEYINLRSFYFMSAADEDYQPLCRVTCIFENGTKSPNIQSVDSKPG